MKTLGILLVLALASAGCASSTSDDAVSEIGGDPPETGEAPVVDPLAGLPDAPTVFTMKSDGTMIPGPPQVGTAEEFQLTSLHNAITGLFPFTLYGAASAAMPAALLIQDADLAVHLRHDSLAVNGAPILFGFDDPFGAGVGTGSSNGEIFFLPGPNPLTPGRLAELAASVPLPNGGLVVPAGDFLALGFGSFYIQVDEVGGLYLLLNSDDAHTRLDVQSEWIVLPESGDAVTLFAEAGSFEGGGGCYGDPAGILGYDFEVPADATIVTVTATAAGNADIDIRVSGPGGEVGAATFPASPEVFKAYAPNIEAVGTGGWTVDVLNCGGPDEQQQATGGYSLDFTIDVRATLLSATPEVAETAA